ncbi:MAG: hypothetical protein M5U18_01225 [Dehalococcoidia bacterium]|nr:hypothetical protein [Dehalococcoidia bacterium]
MTKRAAGAEPEKIQVRNSRRLPAAIVIQHDLAWFVLATGQAKNFRLYAVARERLCAGAFLGKHGRSISPRNGVISVDALVRVLAGLPGQPLGDRRNIRSTLQAGEGTWWDTDRGRLRFPSPDRLAMRLGMPCAGHRVTAYPLAKLAKGAAAFRDMLRDALMPSAPVRLARATQAARTNTSPSTQKRRERAGKALYHDGTGNAPVSQSRTAIDMTSLVPPTVSTSYVANEYRHEGLYAHRNADGEARLFRQAPKTFQAGGYSRRRRPRNQCGGHRLSRHPSATRLIRYGADSKAMVCVAPISGRGLVAQPRDPAFSFENYITARPSSRPVQSDRVKQGVLGGGDSVASVISLSERKARPTKDERLAA